MIIVTPIKHYFSFKYNGENIDNVFQYEANNSQQYYESNPKALDLELWEFYYDMFFSKEFEADRHGFLNYHLNAYSGNKRDFIRLIKKSPKLIPHDVLDVYFRLAQEENNTELVSDWLIIHNQPADPNVDKNSLGAPRERIKLKRLKKPDVEKHFMERLNVVSEYTRKLIMTKEEVLYFLQANIEGFDPIQEIKKIRTQGDFKDISGAVYDFYWQENTYLSPVEAYCRMAWNNFADLDHYKSYESYKSNFSKYSKLK
ncbi:hypothetical protein [Pontibacter vulgaris]|uniref:hypothetical protein n=1 Tax=Pontibacter vulgaris TaxID=2905679 RepID=UPI001FA7DDAA|nr:hypothetical protein [Pontibacter vulgaris]